MKERIEIVGKKYGHLTVIKRVDDYISPNGSHAPVYQCLCDCGNIVNVRKSVIISGSKKSCGCVENEKCQSYKISNAIPKETLIEYYINKQYSLRQLQDLLHIQREVIKNQLVEYGIPIRDGHSDVYYKSRRKYEKWQSGSRDYNKIMEQHIGRPLLENEVVHHIDFNRSNNDIDNLYLFNSNTIHIAYHGYIKYHDYISPDQFVSKYAEIYEKVLSYDFLYLEYIVNCKSVSLISKQNSPVSRRTITKALNKYNLFELRSKHKNQYNNSNLNNVQQKEEHSNDATKGRS